MKNTEIGKKQQSTKNNGLSIMLTAMDQKLQKIIKK